MEGFQLKISLVLATLGRTDELRNFLNLVQNQTFKDFDICVVDQNSDDRLLSILEEYRNTLDIQRLTFRTGLSRARNHGIRHVSGDIICFPDDDCWYQDVTLLERVAAFFEGNPTYNGLLGAVYDGEGKLLYGKDYSRSVVVSWYSCWVLSNSSGIFLRRSALEEVCGFDERMGVGAGTPWSSAEDIEIIARLIHAGHRILYNPEISICHPRGKDAGDDVIRKVYNYARGDGFLLRQQGYPRWFVSYLFLRPAVGTILCILKGNRDMARLYKARLRARWIGYFESERQQNASRFQL